MKSPTSIQVAKILAGFLLSLPLCSFGASLSISIVDQDGEPVDDAVAYVESINGVVPDYTGAMEEVDQLDKTYVPHVKVITRGSEVSFPNSDDIRHHVYSFSDARTFELPLYIGTPANPITFDEAGVVDLGCNIHDFMRAYILVIESPYFSKSVQGRMELEDFPAGTIELVVWHPRLLGDEQIRQQIEISDSDSLELAVELRGERNTGRAPKRRRKRY